MSSLSEIFLMHLKASSMSASSNISIVQDNANTSLANSSFTSLSFCFRESHSTDSAFTSASGKTASKRRTRRRRRSSRWEPDTVPISDGQPDIPTRQNSSNELITDDGDKENTDACVSPLPTPTTTAAMKRRDLVCPAWEQGTQRDSEPKLPRRQSSKRNLSLPRIPRRQNSFRGNNDLEGDAFVDAIHEEQARRKQQRRGTRQVKSFPKARGEAAIAA